MIFVKWNINITWRLVQLSQTLILFVNKPHCSLIVKKLKEYTLVSDLVTQDLVWLSFPKENWRMSQESLSPITKTITRQRSTFASKIQWLTSSDLVPLLPSRGRTTSVAIPCQTPFLASVRLAHLKQIIQTSTGYSMSCLCLGRPWQLYISFFGKLQCKM